MRKCIGAMQQTTLRRVSHGSIYFSSKRCTSSRTVSEFRRPILLPGTPVGGDTPPPSRCHSVEESLSHLLPRQAFFAFFRLSAPVSAKMVLGEAEIVRCKML